MRFIIIFLLSLVLDARMINDFSQSEKNEYIKHLNKQNPQHIKWVNETFLSLAILVSDNIAADVFSHQNIKISDYEPIYKSVQFKDDWLITPDKMPCLKIRLNDDNIEFIRAKHLSEVCRDALAYYKIKRLYCADNLENDYEIKSDLNYLKNDEFLEELQDYSPCFKQDLSKVAQQKYKLEVIFYNNLRAKIYQDLKAFKNDGKDFDFSQVPNDCAKLQDDLLVLNKDYERSSKPGYCSAFLYAIKTLYGDEFFKNGSFTLKH